MIVHKKKLKLEYVSEYGNTYYYGTIDVVFQKWYNHYERDLKEMYHLFKLYSINNSLNYHEYIDYDTFCSFIFDNSSKYLSQWI
jgi:hypothetical protein